ncbi:MAG: erythromycin esterase family protein [Phycisphaeraceae bacterium]|nr:erythromycin esterase family protein [Phycisphaeraceae bacterium]MCW5764160.1 erythromycin esterase family protein [Phycisphaeraceae bacterium]
MISGFNALGLWYVLLLGAALGVVAPIAQAGQLPEDPPDQTLLGPVARLMSIHPEHADNSDLEPIARAIGQARIVVLAQASPDDGAALWAMTRLTRFLIRQHGFSVVAFEAGLYDCRVMNFQFAAGTDPIIAAPQGLSDSLARSGFTSNLWRDTWRSYLTPRPIELCGFSPEFSGLRTARQLPRDLLDFLGSIEPHPLSRDQRRTYLTALERLNEAVQADDHAQVVRVWEHLNQLRSVLYANREALQAATSELEFAWWDRIVTDAVSNAQALMRLAGDDSLVNRRAAIQRRMGEHFVWLATEVYPGRRIIVWADSLTAVRGIDEITTNPMPTSNVPLVSAGQAWHKALGDDLYVLTLTTAGGSRGSIRGDATMVPVPSADTLEARFAGLNWPFLFADLRTTDPREPGWEWLDQPQRSGMLGLGADVGLPSNATARAMWRLHMDGVLFLRSAWPNSFEGRSPEGESHTVQSE